MSFYKYLVVFTSWNTRLLVFAEKNQNTEGVKPISIVLDERERFAMFVIYNLQLFNLSFYTQF